jgi:hypothetical protein
MNPIVQKYLLFKSRILINGARVEYFTVHKYLKIFPIVSILLLYTVPLKKLMT